MKPARSPQLAFLYCIALSLDVFAQSAPPKQASPAAMTPIPALAPVVATSPTPASASSAPTAPAVPAAPTAIATPGAAASAPAATPAVVPPQAPQASGKFGFDERFTSFTEETMPPMARFKYRIWPNTSVTDTKLEANGQALSSTDFRAVPYSSNPLNETALLILVDTSLGSSRQPRTATIDTTKRVIAEIVNQTQPRTKVGLYTFANDLNELAPVGSTPDLVKNKLLTIKADGLGTRLYRRAMDAIEKLSAVDVQRKAILIFSDGKDEDTGYSRENLQEAAEKAGVIVMALGCPETEQDVPALGALEWLADRTKGLYAQLPVAIAGRLPQFPAFFPGSVLQSLDGGGDVSASLKNVPPGAAIVVKLTTQNGQVLEKSFQLAAPPPTPSPTPDLSVSPTPSPTPAPPPLTFWEKIGAYVMAPEHRLWVILGGIVLLLFGIGLLFLLLKLLKSSPPPPPPMPVMPMDDSSDAETTLLGTGAHAHGAALAYLVVQDANATKMPLNKTATRIGRRSDNDLVFSNTSISGHHAEIHMSRDGAFSITDLGSGNGVFVNGERVQQCGLRDGDIIELGEVRFRFSL